MAADAIGIPPSMVHIRSIVDTDISPFGTGAYASRQTYMAGFSIMQTGQLLKERILACAESFTRQPAFNLSLEDGVILRKNDGKQLMTLGELACQALYNTTHSQHLTAEETFHLRNNAFSFGCSFVEVEVDIPLCKVKVLDMLNVHDCGTVINPALAEGQVHGAMSMALGYAMSEKQDFDPATGRPLFNGFSIYGLPTSADHPPLQAEFVENYEPTGAFGNRALGEPPAASGAPAIRNAIYHATGVTINELPMRPEVLYQRFKEEGLL
jgi:xanthine dehydrogenase molybdenum-binding subunit